MTYAGPFYQGRWQSVRASPWLVPGLGSIHNGPMRIARRKLVVVGILVLALMLGTALLGCEEEPTDVDSRAVLDASSSNMKQLAGFHFVYELHQPESAQKAEGVQRVEADFKAEGEMQAMVQYLASGSLINIEVIALADTHYVLFPLAADWTALDPADSPLTKLNLAEGPIKILDNVTSPTFVGVEKRTGKKTYHLTGQVTKEDIESIVGTVSTADVFVADLWIGVDDDLLYEVDVDGPMTDTESSGTWRSIILSHLGVAADIEPPQ